MKISRVTCCITISFVLMFANVALGHAAATVSVSPSGNGQFVVQGYGFAGVEAIELTIQYDATVLANPRVAQGNLISGMPMVTSSAPGQLHYAGTDPYPKARSGSGSLATISFDTVANAAPNVTASITLRDPNGNVLLGQTINVPVKTSYIGPGGGSNTGTDPVSTTVPGPPPAVVTGAANPTYLGTVTMPDSGPANVAKITDDTSQRAPEAEKTQKLTNDAAEKVTAPQVAKAVPETAPQETIASPAGSVLEQFRHFQGEKTPKNLVALFKNALAGSSQEPPLALSDGKTTVKVFVGLPAASKSEPEFALREAKLVSLNKSGDSTWVVELLPNKGTFEAAVIVLQDGKMAELPLTVAPPFSVDSKTGKGRALTEADFTAFLNKRGTGNGDLNSDGKQDYIDDYIFTANFLAQSDIGKTVAEKKPQSAK